MARFSSRLAQIAALVLLPLALAGCLRTIDTSPLQPTPPGAVSNNPQPTATQEIAVVPTEQPSETPANNQPPTEVPQASPTLEQPTNVVAPSPTEVVNQPPTEIPQPSPTEVINQPPTEIPQPSPTEVVQPSPVAPPTEIPQPSPVIAPTDTPVPPPTEVPQPSPTPVVGVPGATETPTLPAGGGGAEQTGTLPAGGGGPSDTAVPMATNAVFYAPPQDGARGTIDDQCRYTVVSNDRLIRIGLRFNRTIAQLMEANHLLSAGLIYPDQKLLIPDCQLP